jgi:hypothetical protein
MTTAIVGGPSTSLLADLFAASEGPGEISQELEKSLFDCLRAKNGVYMTTYANRLDDLNACVANYLPATQPLQILDVGVSCGVSTLEWAQSLEKANLDYEMMGVDLSTKGIMVSFGRRLHVILDSTMRPLLFEINREWLSNPPRKRQLLRHVFSLGLIKCALSVWKKRFWKSGEEEVQEILGMPARTRTISLVTPRLANHPHVVIREGNIMTSSWQKTFHVIRAANILNRGYFDDQSLTKVLSNLCRHLSVGGLLIVCRTNDQESVNSATIFKLTDGRRFVSLSKMNGGSEIESLVLQVRASETEAREQAFARS